MYDRYNRPIDCSGLPRSDNDEECRKTYGFTEWEMIARRERDMAGYKLDPQPSIDEEQRWRDM